MRSTDWGLTGLKKSSLILSFLALIGRQLKKLKLQIFPNWKVISTLDISTNLRMVKLGHSKNSFELIGKTIAL